MEAAGASQLDSTLLILIQKLLGSVAPGTVSMFTSLFANSGAQSAVRLPMSTSVSLNQARFLKRMPTSLPVHGYTSTALGVLLASNLLLRGDAVTDAGEATTLGTNTGTSNTQDQLAVLNFISRAQPIMQDTSILYALDALCLRLERILDANKSVTAAISNATSSTTQSAYHEISNSNASRHAFSVSSTSEDALILCTHLKALIDKTVNSLGITRYLCLIV